MAAADARYRLVYQESLRAVDDQQTALDAADQSLIPGSERDLVRAYFASLGESQGGS